MRVSMCVCVCVCVCVLVCIHAVQDAFASAAERDIYTGDFLEICVITEDGVEHLPLEPLRKD